MEKQSQKEWFEIVALSNKGEAEVHDIEGHQVFIRGGIDNVVLVQVPNDLAVQPAAANHVLKSIEALLERAGITKDVMVVPDNMEFCRLSPVNGDLAKVLEERFHAKQVARVRAHEEARRGKIEVVKS